MENPNKDLLLFIDTILHKMEVKPDAEEITVSNNDIPLPPKLRQIGDRIRILERIEKDGVAEKAETLGFAKLPHFYKIFKPKRKKLLELRKKLTETDQTENFSLPKDIFPFEGKLAFNERTSDLLLSSMKCPIPLHTNQYFLCKKMFGEPFETRVKEIEILDLIDWDKDSKRSVYDAMRAVNQKTKEAFGVEIFDWRNNHIWIKEIFSE